MYEFIEERPRLVRMLADKPDPFTKIRLVKLAERYDEQLRRSLYDNAKYRLALPR